MCDFRDVSELVQFVEVVGPYCHGPVDAVDDCRPLVFVGGHWPVVDPDLAFTAECVE